MAPISASAAAATVLRVGCRSSFALPLRRPSARGQKVHPTTGLPLNRAKGQHLIHNKGVVEKMLQAADIRSYDTIYEVGCGTGELTMGLLPLAERVHTVDVEPRMVQETEYRAATKGFTNLETRIGDALKIPLPDRFNTCVSNLPYQISSPFIFKLMRRLSEGPPWRLAVLMVQKEFAERLLADPGEEPFSRLALSVRLFARTRRIFDVQPGSFIPAPQVHSSIIRLEPRIPAPTVDFMEWDALIRLIFSRRRKTLFAQFKRISTISMLEQNYKIRCSLMGQKPSARPFPELLAHVLQKQGMNNERAFLMDIDDIHGLLRAFHDEGIYFVNVQGQLQHGRGGHESDDAAAEARRVLGIAPGPLDLGRHRGGVQTDFRRMLGPADNLYDPDGDEEDAHPSGLLRYP